MTPSTQSGGGGTQGSPCRRRLRAMNWNTASPTSASRHRARPAPSTTARTRERAASARTGAGESVGTWWPGRALTGSPAFGQDLLYPLAELLAEQLALHLGGGALGLGADLRHQRLGRGDDLGLVLVLHRLQRGDVVTADLLGQRRVEGAGLLFHDLALLGAEGVPLLLAQHHRAHRLAQLHRGHVLH